MHIYRQLAQLFHEKAIHNACCCCWRTEEKWRIKSCNQFEHILFFFSLIRMNLLHDQTRRYAKRKEQTTKKIVVIDWKYSFSVDTVYLIVFFSSWIVFGCCIFFEFDENNGVRLVDRRRLGDYVQVFSIIYYILFWFFCALPALILPQFMVHLVNKITSVAQCFGKTGYRSSI